MQPILSGRVAFRTAKIHRHLSSSPPTSPQKQQYEFVKSKLTEHSKPQPPPPPVKRQFPWVILGTFCVTLLAANNAKLNAYNREILSDMERTKNDLEENIQLGRQIMQGNSKHVDGMVEDIIAVLREKGIIKTNSSNSNSTWWGGKGTQNNHEDEEELAKAIKTAVCERLQVALTPVTITGEKRQLVAMDAGDDYQLNKVLNQVINQDENDTPAYTINEKGEKVVQKQIFRM